MRRNCNLMLRLVPPCSHQNPTDEVDWFGLDANQNRNENQIQQLTIFYDGKISVSDVTDLQARIIIKLASEEIEEKWRSRRGSISSEPSSPLMLSPSQGGLSMKKSLEMFLEKRKHRIQATSPYHR